MFVVIDAYVPQAESANIEIVSISVSIEAEREMYTIVCTIIAMIIHGCTEVEIIAITVATPDSHGPSVTYQMYGTEEIVAIHKLAVLTAAKHIHEVFVTHIEQIVIIIDGIVISEHHIVEYLINLIEEIKIDLIHIFVLTI